LAYRTLKEKTGFGIVKLSDLKAPATKPDNTDCEGVMSEHEWLIDGATIYCLNDKGSNKYWFHVYSHRDDNGNIIQSVKVQEKVASEIHKILCENNKKKSINSELLEALKGLLSACTVIEHVNAMQIAFNAIKKAEVAK